MNIAGIKSRINSLRAKYPDVAQVLEEILLIMSEDASIPVLDNNKYVQGYDATGAVRNLIGIDNGDRIRVSPNQAGASGKGHFFVPAVVTAELPALGADNAGLIAVDTSTGDLCFYTAGNRYKADKTAF